jgi:leucyl aminopeptidase
MLDLIVGQGDPPAELVDALVVICGEGDLESALVRQLDAKLGGLLTRAAAEERFRAKPGQLLSVHVSGSFKARRVILVGAGSLARDPARALRVAGGSATRAAAAAGATRAAIAWCTGDGPAPLEAVAEGALLGTYRFDKYLTGERAQPSPLAAVTLHAPSAVNDAAPVIARARTTAQAVARARDLVNEPAGYLTPTRIAATAEAWATQAGMSVEIRGRAECAGLGMGLFLAVAQGS